MQIRGHGGRRTGGLIDADIDRANEVLGGGVAILPKGVMYKIRPSIRSGSVSPLPVREKGRDRRVFGEAVSIQRLACIDISCPNRIGPQGVADGELADIGLVLKKYGVRSADDIDIEGMFIHG